MIDVEPRKRPRPTFAGFLLSFAAQAAVVAAYRTSYFADAGWQGGEYAYAFIGIAVGSIVLGCVLRFFRPPWSPVGTGLLLAGVLGFALVVTVFVLFLAAFSHWGS